MLGMIFLQLLWAKLVKLAKTAKKAKKANLAKKEKLAPALWTSKPTGVVGNVVVFCKLDDVDAVGDDIPAATLGEVSEVGEESEEGELSFT
jgi:hypothetical protein